MKRICLAFALSPLALSAAGCHIGEAPEPMTPGQVQTELQKLTPQQQIDWYNRSPMPPEEKKKKIDEIKAKAGITGDTPTSEIPGGPNVPGKQ